MFSQTPVFTNNIGRQGAFKKETRAKTMIIGKGSDICAGSFSPRGDVVGVPCQFIQPMKMK